VADTAVLDVFSRLIVGWAIEARLGSKLVLAALQMAYTQRRPKQVIHHSDHGSEYTAIAFGRPSRLLLPAQPAVGKPLGCRRDS
jgi:putative transposase